MSRSRLVAVTRGGNQNEREVMLRAAHTRLIRRAVARHEPELDFGARVALFAGSRDSPRAAALLVGLCRRPRRSAETFLASMSQWSSAMRQARLAHEFGHRADQLERLSALLELASGPLKAELFARLAPWQQSALEPAAATATASPCRALAALAERLVREAVR